MLRKVNDIHRNYIAANYAAVEDPTFTIGTFTPDHPNHERWSFEHYYGDPPRRHAWVAAFEVDRHYGGSEEGGWWYDSEQPVAIIPVMSEEGAHEAIALLERYYEVVCEGDSDRYSVRGDSDIVIRFCVTPPKSSPDERPHYE